MIQHLNIYGKTKETRKWLEKVILFTTGINLEYYTLVDNKLNTENSNKDYRLDIVLRQEHNIVNIR